jgi:choline transport protein
MNYVCVVYVVVGLVIAADWFGRGKRRFRRQEVRHLEPDEGVGEYAD